MNLVNIEELTEVTGRLGLSKTVVAAFIAVYHHDSSDFRRAELIVIDRRANGVAIRNIQSDATR